MVDRILMMVIGGTFVAGGLLIAWQSLEAKNLIESAMFGLLGFTVGLFLVISAIVGCPTY